MINIAAEVDQRISEIPQGIEIAPQSREIAVSSLEGINRRYGEDSENPLEFHNVPHSSGVMGRTISLTNLLIEFIPKEYRPQIYDLAVNVPATHDYEQLLGPGANEQASVQYLLREIEHTGNSPINTEWFKKRAELGSLATEVAFAEDGEIMQVNLGHGEPDPFAFIVAFADINGIAMEGRRRMIRDATNLCFEMNGGNPGAEKICDFLLTQASFLKGRLNDYHMKPLIGYYFPERDEEVYDTMHTAYNDNITSAHNMASVFKENPKLYSTVDQAMEGLDRIHAGAVVGALLRRL